MFHRKRKLTKISGAKPGSDPPIKYWVKGFILPHMYHDPNFYEDSGLLQLTKNSKTKNNIAGYHLLSRCVNSTPSDVQHVYR